MSVWLMAGSSEKLEAWLDVVGLTKLNRRRFFFLPSAPWVLVDGGR